MQLQINNTKPQGEKQLLNIVRGCYLASSIVFVALLALLVVCEAGFLESYRNEIYFAYFGMVLACYTALDKMGLAERHFGWVVFSLLMAPVTLLTLLLVKVIYTFKLRNP